MEAEVLGSYIVVHDRVPVNRSQSRSSPEVAHIQKDTRVDVLEFASELIDGRVRARIAHPAGWISTRMADDSKKYAVKAAETVIEHAEESEAIDTGEVEPGSTCAVCHAALPVTVSEIRGSTELAKLSIGAMVEVRENVTVHEGRERARIASLVGWISTELQRNEPDNGTLQFVVKVGARNACIVEYDLLPVTATACRDSATLAVLRRGARVEVLETAAQRDQGRVRARVACPPGWISTRMVDGTVQYVKASLTDDDINDAIEAAATADELQDRLDKMRSAHPNFDFASAEQVLQNRRDAETAVKAILTEDINDAIEATVTADELQDRLDNMRSAHPKFDFSRAEQVLQNRRDAEMPLRLFHGTSRVAAEAIQMDGFKPSPSDDSNREELGKGVYLVDCTNVPKALRFAHDCFVRCGGATLNEPVLIECDVFVRKGHYKGITGSDPEGQWHVEGYDAVLAEKTSKSNSSEVCVYDPRRIKVVAVHDLRNTACPWNEWCPF